MKNDGMHLMQATFLLKRNSIDGMPWRQSETLATLKTICT